MDEKSTLPFIAFEDLQDNVEFEEGEYYFSENDVEEHTPKMDEATPQPLAICADGATTPMANQLAIKAKDSLEKKKMKVSSGKGKKGRKYYSPRKGKWRGLNDPFKHSEVQQLIRKERLSLCGLVETKVKERNKEKEVDVVLINSSDQVMHVHVRDLAKNSSFIVSIVYGDNCPIKRSELWADLVSHSVGWESSPWVLMGDFNAIKSQEEMDKAPIMKKLDRVLANLRWECDFSGSKAYFPPSGVLDHSPMVVTLAALPSRKTPFKFFDLWAEHPQFLSVVAKAWAIDVKGSPMYQLCHKLKYLKGELKKFNMEFFANLPRRVVRAEEALEESRSKITSISTDDGARVETPGEVNDTIVQFFQNLLGSHTVAGVDEDMLQRVLPKRLTEIQREDLDRSISDDEIRMVMFSLKDNKAPGPDGFSAGFFKKAWKIVGADVQNPTKVKDFRPISCCNTVYKCIAKLIANRVKVVLSRLVGPFQTAFVASRRISDNIILCQELMRNYHRSGGSSRCALKVDLMKAYDSVQWNFLLAVLRVMGFSDRVVRWIAECISTTRFSISINGELHGFFPGGRGLRQGDPMSPYLFVLAIEVFSSLMANMVRDSGFKYNWHCEKEKISHLCFADDLMIFCKADLASVSLIGGCLQQFRDISGLIPNPDKSSMFICGVPSELRMQLLDILGYNEGALPIRYLGVPLIMTKLKATDCKNAKVEAIIDRQEWHWPICRSPAWLELISSTPTSFRPDSRRPDVLQWIDAPKGSFSVRGVWESLRLRHSKVDWWKLVWHSQAIPRMSFILWLAIQDALYTQAKLIRFGIIQVAQ
ncbi:uncharacterized protein LOC120106373 [Phoenix dactylifera]|uniref:Uncharacterized protein LOC120106373 n=1 Tax=Phoenix dactylifera TaxID=42345 RepID=A0A8B8ZM63_PHODC|nr:uncharacterized protein LOC120106373 [Phoenix dactylifera]